MRRLFLLLLVAAVILVVGVYRGWLQFSSHNQGDNANLNIAVDKHKIRQDTNQAANKLQNLAQQAKDKVTTTQKDHD